MLLKTPLAKATDLRAAFRAAYCMDEVECVKERLEQAYIAPDMKDRVNQRATSLVAKVRKERVKSSGIDAFMHEYELSSEEGVILMCLAEALLRIPDKKTADDLISDKIGGANWESHLGHSESSFVNASTWALMLTGRIVNIEKKAKEGWSGILQKMIHRSGEPVIRSAVVQAMRILGKQFVMGRNINEALKRARSMEEKGYRYSYDMLGEAARTMADAERYYQEYQQAIHEIGKVANGRGVIFSPGVSVKLSALHPRYDYMSAERVLSEMVPKVVHLCELAAKYDIGLCIDAEEADRLDLSMDILEAVCRAESIRKWQGLGLAIQAYQKRCAPLVDLLTDMARRNGRRFMVRLVKGAYWDTEVKMAQEQGLEDYPVFTQKANTDVSYLACAKKLLAAPDAFYPCFATHNAHSVAAIMELAGEKEFEFQCLHGMGDALYDQVVGFREKGGYPVRIYAPVGSHEDLLAYLVRRLLENGANSSFVNRIVDETAPIAEIIADPIQKVASAADIRHPKIPLPANLYGESRVNSQGIDIRRPEIVSALSADMQNHLDGKWFAGPLIGGQVENGVAHPVLNPANRSEKLGHVDFASHDQAVSALDRAYRAQPAWDRVNANERADILDRAADLFET
ncbi:MAG: bifunctional proline dehydrogenase/L-glutamate gamma-semialdehyde dehydrogenase PutA, partial [Alphaproteobacteria bacterium]|nr:bifunctional proline dehydrogenase/L-glutamate gamma-semialdehyde dehydrogenase PutA [Alphaproteobacteria bacterium]